ncbi:hypothetical protein AKJ43_01625 [candidate division MSBL1 archaeon SCGC-AAA261D19]|uniref:Tritrans,polycis-undecaprenyl-diphosphate synthase (geranylgeranyl-diphosphate specific) n=1 Tax=candidate division MSBL1 archaeon SCGC-AAA261D19 TaxID=1698273 RepID=A0A133V7U3_9EURY|nr:hypothetical protein AKJ43_01625 [candidate division MSBL1 archaeon SCGC-AAA261D19]
MNFTETVLETLEKLPGLKDLRAMVADYYERRLFRKVKARGNLPRHVAIITNGKGTSKQGEGIPTPEGGKLDKVLEWCRELGIKHATVFALPIGLLKRSDKEVKNHMRLFKRRFKEITKDEKIHDNKIRVRGIGEIDSLPKEIKSTVNRAEEATKGYDRYFLNIAVGYGGRQELAKAIMRISELVKKGELEPEDISENTIDNHLYTAGQPDPDLIIRTSERETLSGFLLWQSAYSELYFCEANWPAFDKKDFLRAISTYQRRERRFGE